MRSGNTHRIMNLCNIHPSSRIPGKRTYRVGVMLTSIGAFFFLLGITDLLLRLELSAPQMFFIAGIFVTLGWGIEQAVADRHRSSVWVTPLWKRSIIAVLPLVILFFASGAGDLWMHDKIAEAAYSGDLETVQRLAPFDLELSGSPGEFHYTPLHAATMEGNYRIVKYLISRGVDVNRPSDHGEMPLRSARTANRQDIAALLVAAGAHE